MSRVWTSASCRCLVQLQIRKIPSFCDVDVTVEEREIGTELREIICGYVQLSTRQTLYS